MRFTRLAPGLLDKLASEGKPIYIINTSKMANGDKGTVVVNFNTEGSRKLTFTMPPTFIPMSVSDSIPVQILLNSPDFKQCLLKGMLSLVDSAEAEAYLGGEEAKEEYESLLYSQYSSLNRSNVGSSNESLNTRSQIQHVTSDSQGPVDDIGQATEEPSARVRGLVESMIANDISPSEVLRSLKRQEENLTDLDLSYVLGQSSDTKLTKWCKQVLADAGSDNPVAKAMQTTKKKVAKKKLKPKAAAPKKPEPQTFALDDDGIEMTAEEARADAKAKAEAMANQSLYGESKSQEEIDRLLRSS